MEWVKNKKFDSWVSIHGLTQLGHKSHMILEIYVEELDSVYFLRLWHNALPLLQSTVNGRAFVQVRMASAPFLDKKIMGKVVGKKPNPKLFITIEKVYKDITNGKTEKSGLE